MRKRILLITLIMALIILLTALPAHAAWLSGWGKRVELTIDNSDITANLSNFPILVYLSTSSGRNSDNVSFVFDELQDDANRKKIAVTKSDGTTECYVEIEKWDDTNEQAWLWVKVSGTDSISSSSDTDLYLYYDIGHADNTTYVDDTNTGNSYQVWDDGGDNYFKAVWHLDEWDATPATRKAADFFKDSTSYDNDGQLTDTDDDTAQLDGRVYKAVDFAGDADYINFGNNSSLVVNQPMSISAWIKIATTDDGFYNKGSAINPADGWSFKVNPSGNLRLLTNSANYEDNVAVNNDVWRFVSFTRETNTVQFYVDGSPTLSRSVSKDWSANTDNAIIGCENWGGLSKFFLGGVDEVRISSTKRSAAWISASYESERDHLLDFGSEVTLIYRSVAPNKTTAVDSHSGGFSCLITISGSTATFDTDVADNVGVGDVILYDSEEDNDLDGSDTIVFIHGRTDAQNFTVKEHDGSAPSNTTSANDYWAIYRAHTSLSNAEAGTENSTLSGMGFSYNGGNRNLDTNDETWNIACYANGTTADTAYVNFSGWYSDDDNYIKIYTPTSTSEVGESQRHNGKWDDTAYHLAVTGYHAMYTQQHYLFIEGLQIQVTLNNTDDYYGIWNEGGDYNEISDCIFRGDLTGTSDWGCGIFVYNSGTAYLRIWNNIFYDWKNGSYSNNYAMYLRVEGALVYNNTIYNSYNGIYDQVGNTVGAKNNIVQGANDGYIGTFYSSSDYNISNLASDAPNNDFTAGDSAIDVAFVNENSGSEDLHLATFDTSAKNVGTDLSSDTYLAFSDDIDGADRSPDGAGWDIGADEYTGLFGAEGLNLEGINID